MGDGPIIRTSDDGDLMLRHTAGRTVVGPRVPIGEPVHLRAVSGRTRWRKRPRVRIYLNGWRQRRPAWLWTRINRVRERRFNRNAIG